MSSPNPLPALSLEQFLALNDELAALSRAGVPLEKGLSELSRDLPGRVSTAAEALGKRLEQGENLAQIIADDQSVFPPVYRAAVIAGLRSGKLAVALEGVSATARRTAELRRVVGFALLYPLLVVWLAFFFFNFLATRPMLSMERALTDLESADSGLLAPIISAGHVTSQLQFVVLTTIPLALFLWWYLSGRAMWGGKRSWFGSVPTAGTLLRAGRLATFADVLALLVEQRVPLAEAIALSAAACGDRRLKKAGQELAARLEQGTLAEHKKLPDGFPPLLGWMLVTGARHESLARTLRSAAENYRRRALRLADWLTTYLPMIATAGIGGPVVALYALAVLGPYFRILFNLSQP